MGYKTVAALVDDLSLSNRELNEIAIQFAFVVAKYIPGNQNSSTRALWAADRWLCEREGIRDLVQAYRALSEEIETHRIVNRDASMHYAAMLSARFAVGAVILGIDCLSVQIKDRAKNSLIQSAMAAGYAGGRDWVPTGSPGYYEMLAQIEATVRRKHPDAFPFTWKEFISSYFRGLSTS